MNGGMYAYVWLCLHLNISPKLLRNINLRQSVILSHIIASMAQSPLKLSIDDGQCNRKKVTQHIRSLTQFFFPPNAAMAEEKNVINHFSSLFCHIHVDSCFFMCVVSLEMKMFDVCLYFTALWRYMFYFKSL